MELWRAVDANNGGVAQRNRGGSVSEIRNKVNSDPDPYKSERKGKGDDLMYKKKKRCSHRKTQPSLKTRYRRKIRLIDNNAKCRHLTKFTCKGTLRHVFYLSEVPSSPIFCNLCSVIYYR